MKGILSATVLLSILAILFLTEVESQIPAEALKFAKGKAIELFSCSRFDGYASCFHKDAAKRDSQSAGCSNVEKWEYDYRWGGKCYCYKCK